MSLMKENCHRLSILVNLDSSLHTHVFITILILLSVMYFLHISWKLMQPHPFLSVFCLLSVNAQVGLYDNIIISLVIVYNDPNSKNGEISLLSLRCSESILAQGIHSYLCRVYSIRIVAHETSVSHTMSVIGSTEES